MSEDYLTIAGGRDALGQPWDIGVVPRGLVIALPGVMMRVPGPDDGSTAMVPARLLFEGADRQNFIEAITRAATPEAPEGSRG